MKKITTIIAAIIMSFSTLAESTCLNSNWSTDYLTNGLSSASLITANVSYTASFLNSVVPKTIRAKSYYVRISDNKLVTVFDKSFTNVLSYSLTLSAPTCNSDIAYFGTVITTADGKQTFAFCGYEH